MPCPEPREKLTPAQRREALLLFERGFIIWPLSYRDLTRHKPLQVLVEIGLADIGNGPIGSWLKTMGYYSVWSDPIC